MERKLINYLPRFMQEYEETKKVMETEQVEIDTLWTAADNTLNNQFITDATEYGVKRWESMMKISPKGTDTLDERKFRILAELNQQLPYTFRQLEQMLTTMCGADGYSMTVKPNEYHIEVKLALINKNNYQDVENILAKVIPANMTQYVQIMYNTNAVVGQFTHENLKAYTYYQVRNEVLTNA